MQFQALTEGMEIPGYMGFGYSYPGEVSIEVRFPIRLQACLAAPGTDKA